MKTLSSLSGQNSAYIGHHNPKPDLIDLAAHIDTLCMPKQPARQENMVCLPDPSNLPSFQYYDPDSDKMQDITYSDGFQPRRIEDHVLNPADWHPENRKRSCGANPSSPGDCNQAHEAKSRAGIFASMVNDEDSCRVCGSQGDNCLGDKCVTSFQNLTERVEHAGKLRIEAAGGQGDTSMGYGVFTGGWICQGDIVGEYLGRLLPRDWNTSPDQDHSYSFELEDVALVDAREYGSVGGSSLCLARPL